MSGRWAMGARPKQALLVTIDEDAPASPLVVPRLLRIADAAKYLSATTWQIETLLRGASLRSHRGRGNVAFEPRQGSRDF